MIRHGIRKLPSTVLDDDQDLCGVRGRTYDQKAKPIDSERSKVLDFIEQDGSAVEEMTSEQIVAAKYDQ